MAESVFRQKKEHVAQHPLPLVRLALFFPFRFHIAAIKMVSVTASLLQYVRLSVVSLFVYLSLLVPCCLRARQAVPIKRAQGGLLWQQLLWCAALLSVCVSERVCALLSPGRAGQTGPVHMEPAPLVSFVVTLGIFPV